MNCNITKLILFVTLFCISSFLYQCCY